VYGKTYFKETFDDSYTKRWVVSDWKSGEQGKFGHTAGDWYGDAKEDKGLQTTQDAKFYAISAKFPGFSNEGKDLVIQFQVKFPQKIDCGGG
jgi:calreticulin